MLHLAEFCEERYTYSQYVPLGKPIQAFFDWRKDARRQFDN